MDRKNGDLICTQCGTVATESLMHEGSQFRKFEGEADRNHHGDAANPLFSNAYNMSTTLGGLGFQTGAGVGGFGSMQKRGIENILKNAHMYTEINLSQMGKDEKRTRDGYKNQQKKEAFMKMKHIGDALGLHEAVVRRAKELFAGFRDDRELVQQFKGVVAACLIEAFDQLSNDGRQILKIRTGETEEDPEDDDDDDLGDETNQNRPKKKKVTNARASKRNDLHSASLAGRGGDIMDNGDRKIVGGVAALAAQMSKPVGNDKGTAAAAAGAAGTASSIVDDEEDLSPTEKKSAASWNLDDCRSWLREASIAIAKQWTEQREEEGKNASSFATAAAAKKNLSAIGANTKTALRDIPKGTLDELQGILIEHTLTLCVFLEEQVQKFNSKGGGVGGKGPHGAGGGYSRGRVTTPRVNDMGKMSIRWQHHHERGSGGKGGVGNSGRTTLGIKIGERTEDGRAAGQILILNSKKLGSILSDRVSGDAFYREFRALLGRQEARKKKGLRQEATMQRLKQMNRKQYVLARARK